MKQGWTNKPLGEICVVDWGNTDLTKSAYVEGGKYLAVSAAGCDGRIGHKEHEKYTPVLSAIGAQCGRMFLPEEDFTAIKNTITLTPRDGCCTGRFLYQLLTYVELPKRGAAQPFISKGDIQTFQVPVPPLAEQRRIVEVLDEAFAGLATAQANAEKNLQNARALFESHLQSVFTRRGEGWVEKPLAQLCDVFEDGDWIETKDQSLAGIRLVQTGNVGEGFFKDRAEKARYISEATFKRLRCTEVFEGDCLISRLPDPVGRSCILPSTGDRMITAVDCTIVRLKKTQLLPTLFNLYSQSSDYISAVSQRCTGATRSRISRSNLGLISIPLPPMAEQAEIVEKLDVLSAETQRLTQIYEQKLAALASFKKSLLHQAFNGDL